MLTTTKNTLLNQLLHFEIAFNDAIYEQELANEKRNILGQLPMALIVRRNIESIKKQFKKL